MTSHVPCQVGRAGKALVVQYVQAQHIHWDSYISYAHICTSNNIDVSAGRLIDLNPQSLCVLRLCILFDSPKEPLSKWIDWIKNEWVSRSVIKCLPTAIACILAIDNWYFNTKRGVYFWVSSCYIVPEVVCVFSTHGLVTLSVWTNAWIVWLAQNGCQSLNKMQAGQVRHGICPKFYTAEFFISVLKIFVSKKSLGIGLDEFFWSRHSVLGSVLLA